MSFLISKAELEYHHLDYENSSEELIKADLRLLWTGVSHLTYTSVMAGLQNTPFEIVSFSTAKELRGILTRALHPDVAFRVYSECGASRFADIFGRCWPAVEPFTTVDFAPWPALVASGLPARPHLRPPVRATIVLGRKRKEDVMAKMPKDCMDMVNNVYAAAVATCDQDGVPNVVCCSMKQAWDDETIMISDQYMNKTLANLRANPRMAVTVWDETHGYQIKGTVVYENEGPSYEAIAKQVHQILSSMGYDYYSKGVCWMHVDEVFSVTPGPNAGEKLA